MEQDTLLNLREINAERRKAVPPLHPLTEEHLTKIKAMFPGAHDTMIRRAAMQIVMEVP